MMKCFTRYAAAVLVTAAAGICAVSGALADEARVVDGVYIAGTDVSGMTQDEVRSVIDEKLQASAETQVTVIVNDQTQTCTLGDLGLAWANEEILDEICELGLTGNIVQRYKDQQDLKQQNKNYEIDYQIDETKVQTFAESLSAFDSEPVNAQIYTTDQLTPGVSGGTDGVTVDTDGTAQVIADAAKAWDGSSAISVEAVTEIVSPDVTYEDMAILCDVLGTATTDYSASSAARCVNVENGCSKITGTYLEPGDYFSVTEALVPFTAENGYEQAPSYEENRVVNSYGGGICQVSTTLYNAVLKAEMEVTERNNHTMVVSYVPLSKDAAIAEGVMDLSFYNSLDYPVYIIGYCYGGQITFTIYGHETRPANRTLEFESRTISTIEPTAAKLYANTSQAVGYIGQTQSAHTGYTAELWKNIYYDGVLSESVQVNSSYYTAVGVIYDIGVMTSNTALQTAMYAAIAANDLTQVQAVIASAASYTTQTETSASADTSGTTTDTTSGTAADGSTDASAASGQTVDGSSGDWDETVVVVQ